MYEEKPVSNAHRRDVTAELDEFQRDVFAALVSAFNCRPFPSGLGRGHVSSAYIDGPCNDRLGCRPILLKVVKEWPRRWISADDITVYMFCEEKTYFGILYYDEQCELEMPDGGPPKWAGDEEDAIPVPHSHDYDTKEEAIAKFLEMVKGVAINFNYDDDLPPDV